MRHNRQSWRTHPLFSSIKLLFDSTLSHLPIPARKRISWFVFGLLLSQSVILRRIAMAMAGFQSGSFNVESHERRLRRIQNDLRLNWIQTYVPVLLSILQWQGLKQLTLIIDETGHSKWVRTMMISVWYRGRALPLCWFSWPAQKKNKGIFWKAVELLLERVELLSPDDCRIVLIGDRAFGNTPFIDKVTRYGWDFLVRIQKRTCYLDDQGCIRKVGESVAKPGEQFKGRGKAFKGRGWRDVSLIVWWDNGYKEPLIIISSLAPSYRLVKLYRQRGGIECLFRDYKSSGWQWEVSQVKDARHHERLLLGMGLATLLTFCLGEQVVEEYLENPASKRRSQSYIGKCSVFTLGLQRLQGCLYQTNRGPSSWKLSEFEAEKWQRQVLRRNIGAYYTKENASN